MRAEITVFDATLVCTQADRDKREAVERAEREKQEAEEAVTRQLAEQHAAASAKEADLKSTLQQKQQVCFTLLVADCRPHALSHHV